jgi:nucleotide sugar dehydrogenase
MIIATRPSAESRPSMPREPRPCFHDQPRHVSPWTGEPGTAGTVAVIGAGRKGLPSAAQFASHGWQVLAVDVRIELVEAINAGRSPLAEPGLDELIGRVHGEGHLRAADDDAAAARSADVVVVTVPVQLDEELQPDFRLLDEAIDGVVAGLHPGVLVVFETTLPVGATRGRYGPRLASVGLGLERELFVAASPERTHVGAALRSLAVMPRLVGGLGPASSARAAAFYDSVLDTDVVAMSSVEAAELAKLAETTYRDVNIALANELARYTERAGLDVNEVIAAANSHPESDIHVPGLGVGGPFLPIYPQFLLSVAPEVELAEHARRVNDGQLGMAIRSIQATLGGLEGASILVLGLTYRAGVRDLNHSRGMPLVERLAFHGARVSAWDPMLDTEEIARSGATPWRWGEPGPFRVIVTQTDDPAFASLDFGWFPELELLFDGRNSLRDVPLPADVTYQGIGLPARPEARSRTNGSLSPEPPAG